jgi:hypothetical protein
MKNYIIFLRRYKLDTTLEGMTLAVGVRRRQTATRLGRTWKVLLQKRHEISAQ